MNKQNIRILYRNHRLLFFNKKKPKHWITTNENDIQFILQYYKETVKIKYG
jgi:hypothetical protein